MIKYAMVFLFFIGVHVKGHPITCKTMYRKYDLDPIIKSTNGWIRVCKKGILYRYTDKNITSTDIPYLCNCLISGDQSEDRTLTNFTKE